MARPESIELGHSPAAASTPPMSAPSLLQRDASQGLHEFSLPPVDGGKHAWFFLAASFFVEALTWGMYLQRLVSSVEPRWRWTGVG